MHTIEKQADARPRGHCDMHIATYSRNFSLMFTFT